MIDITGMQIETKTILGLRSDWKLSMTILMQVQRVDRRTPV